MPNISRPATDVNTLLQDTVKAAQIVGVTVDQEATRKVIDAYQDYFLDGSLAFRTTNHPEEKRDISLRYTHFVKEHDPYAIALDHGFIVEKGHPIETLLYQTHERFPILGHGIDVGVKHGFEKIWPWFKGGMPNEDVASMPSYPQSMSNYLDYFKKYRLNGVWLLALDYWNKSTNIYFLNQPGTYSTEEIAGMIGDLGFQVPGQSELELNTNAVWIYYTFTWNSPKVERLSYVFAGPGDTFPQDFNPVLNRFVNKVPIDAPVRFFTYNTCYSRHGDYLKVEADYTGILAGLFDMVLEYAV